MTKQEATLRVFTKEWKSRLKRNRLTEQLTKRQRTTEREEQPGSHITSQPSRAPREGEQTGRVVGRKNQHQQF